MSSNCSNCKKYHFRSICEKCHHKCCDDVRTEYKEKKYVSHRGYDDHGSHDKYDGCNTCYYPKDKCVCKKEYYEKDRCNKCYYPKSKCGCGKEVYHHDKCSKCYYPKHECKCRKRSQRSYKCNVLDNFNAKEIARLQTDEVVKCYNNNMGLCKPKCCCKKDLTLEPVTKALKAKYYNKKCGYYLCHWDNIRQNRTDYDTYTVMLCGSQKRAGQCVDVVLNISTGSTDEEKCGDVKYELCVTRVCGKQSVSCVEGHDVKFVKSTRMDQQGNPYSLRWCNIELGVDRTILAFRRVEAGCVEEYAGFKSYKKPVCIEEVCVYEE